MPTCFHASSIVVGKTIIFLLCQRFMMISSLVFYLIRLLGLFYQREREHWLLFWMRFLLQIIMNTMKMKNTPCIVLLTNCHRYAVL